MKLTKTLAYTILLGGVVGGILFIIFFLMLHWLTSNPFAPDVKSLDFFVYILVIVSTLLLYRFKFNQGKMSFWEGLLSGVGVSLLMASISAVFIYFFLSKIAPHVLDLHIKYLLSTLTSNPEAAIESFGKENYEKILKDVKNTSPSEMAFYELRVKLLISSLMSFISAAVIRKGR